MRNVIEQTASVRGEQPLTLAPSLGIAKSAGSAFRHLLIEIIAVYDCVAIIASGFIAQVIYFAAYKREIPQLTGYLSIILAAAIIFQLVARQRGQYNKDRIYDWAWQLSSLIYLCAVTFIVTFALLFFMKTSDHYSRVWFAGWAFLSLAFLAVGRSFFERHIKALVKKGALRRSVALVGGGVQFQLSKKMLLRHDNQYYVAAILDVSEFEGRDDANVPLDIQLHDFMKKAQESDVEEIMIALPATSGLRLERIVRQICSLPVDVKVLPDFGGARIGFSKTRSEGDLSFVVTGSKPISEWGQLIKSVEDYVLAGIGLFLAMPAMAIIALAIKLDSAGPVFFRQKRHGYNHKIIEVFKFRTMSVLENGAAVTQATKNDKRVTRVGWFLRRTSLDELPQLINVLLGEMSIVSPRPHAIAHNELYQDVVEDYVNRHKVKPGITGWAQVHGCRGETRNSEMMAARIRYDLDYIENWSLWLDIKIIIMTPLYGLFSGNAY